jgi:hypothetical protein
MKDESEDFGKEIQKLILACMIDDHQSFALAQNIIKSEYFDDNLRPAARFILEYANKYKKLPTRVLVYAETNVKIIEDDASKLGTWFIDKIEKFCQYRALEGVILESMELIDQGKGGEVQRRIKAAMEISLVKDLGSNYWDDIQHRLERLKDRKNIVSSGWKTLDDKLYGGFERGSLNIFCAPSGQGKSLFLQNIARNWSIAGKNVIYISLELGEDLINLRLDAMITNQSTSEALKGPKNTALKAAMISKQTKIGKLMVKRLPEAGTTCNTIAAYVKEFEIQEGIKPDGLIVDYLDLLYPNNDKLDVSNLWVKDKYVAEELRSVAGDLNIPCVSASQLGRTAIEAQEYDNSHIAGGISKINTADNVFGIYTSMSMKDRGVFQLQFLKTRTSSSVGQKIELAYNTSTMAIDDLPEDNSKILKPETTEEIKKKLNAPTITPINEPTMSISQMAHPEHKSREQIESEKKSSNNPDMNQVANLMNRIRNKNEN